jgi:Helix-turn-helix domain
MPFHPGHRGRAGNRPASEPDRAELVGPTPLDADAEQLLYTPAEAAGLLRIRESWLRRRAAARLVPCTFLGRHLRFSAADLAAIIAAHAEPVGAGRRRRRRSRRGSGSDLMSGPVRSVDASDRDDHHRGDGSSTWPG